MIDEEATRIRFGYTSDLSNYTMKMTRSQHTYLHWNMTKAGIKVPHINITGVI